MPCAPQGRLPATAQALRPHRPTGRQDARLASASGRLPSQHPQRATGTFLELAVRMGSMVADARQRLGEYRSALERCLQRGQKVSVTAAHDLEEAMAAIARIDLGTYGRCERCGGAIGRQRLLALPAARYCGGCAVAVPDALVGGKE